MRARVYGLASCNAMSWPSMLINRRGMAHLIWPVLVRAGAGGRDVREATTEQIRTDQPISCGALLVPCVRTDPLPAAVDGVRGD
jgi:hypothetical protein